MSRRVEPSFCDLLIGDALQLELQEADGQPVATTGWESMNTSVATVDSDGWLVAVGEGDALILADLPYTGDAHPRCNVTVRAVPTDQPLFRMAEKHVVLASGGSTVLVVDQLQGSSVTHAHVYEWTSSDATVASVDEHGRVHAGNPGRARISAVVVDPRAGSVVEAEVEVVAGFLGFVSYRTEHERYRVVQGGTVEVRLIGTRPDGTEEYAYPEQWACEAHVATADPSGVVTGVGPGRTTLSAMYDGGRAVVVEVDLTVVPGVRGGTAHHVEPQSSEVAVGGQVQLRLYGAAPPAWDDGDGFDQPVIWGDERAAADPVLTTAQSWTSSDESVATVDDDGLVTGISPGAVEVTATVAENVIAVASVRVTA